MAGKRHKSSWFEKKNEHFAEKKTFGRKSDRRRKMEKEREGRENLEKKMTLGPFWRKHVFR